ncbi:MAG: DUF4190 domain-containing protein [Clostridia bacterium]|nr:DUF4190 domain-containing protein [Clostridia bacterium]
MSEFHNGYNQNREGFDQGRIVIEPRSRSKAWSVVALILSILSVVCCCIDWFGVVCGVLALVFSIISRRSLGYFDGLSIAAIIVSIFGIVFSALLMYVGYLLINNEEFMQYYESLIEEVVKESGIEIFHGVIGK